MLNFFKKGALFSKSRINYDNHLDDFVKLYKYFFDFLTFTWISSNVILFFKQLKKINVIYK